MEMGFNLNGESPILKPGEPDRACCLGCTLITMLRSDPLFLYLILPPLQAPKNGVDSYFSKCARTRSDRQVDIGGIIRKGEL